MAESSYFIKDAHTVYLNDTILFKVFICSILSLFYNIYYNGYLDWLTYDNFV